MHWYVKGLKNYVGFQGRAGRKEYWMFVLINFIIAIILSIVETIADLPLVLTSLYYLAVLLPSLAITVRRLHDTGRSGLWLLISLIPFIGAIVLLVFACQSSQESDNQYGSNPQNSFQTI
ncbi:DUF805 domain-containing protein [Bacillus sp. V3B]|uniref:DUF805 domain-containing protein n=1 Tax=Bacillus sp. V3B TaxID=2804915 RepID=UPI002109B099|nr:DUF805 domain-containing protein [Bacillus sp. V3B]MCQ6275458.1 DUF805 domain-containing protein [Bacillus sp. V3B]